MNNEEIEPTGSMVIALVEARKKRMSRMLFLSEEIMKSTHYFEEENDRTLGMIAKEFSENPSDEVMILEYLEKNMPMYARNILDLKHITVSDIEDCLKEDLGWDMYEIPREKGKSADYWGFLNLVYGKDIANGGDVGIDTISMLFFNFSVRDEAQDILDNNKEISKEFIDETRANTEMLNDPEWKVRVHMALKKRYPDRFNELNFYRLKFTD